LNKQFVKLHFIAQKFIMINNEAKKFIESGQNFDLKFTCVTIYK